MPSRAHRFSLMASLLCTSLSLACIEINSINGSFVVDVESGRYLALTKDESQNIHYYRMYLKQFEEEIGGIVEIFQYPSGHEGFRLEPAHVARTRPGYYCMRSDKSYVHNGQVYISFTDQVQRHWQFKAKLGAVSLSGVLDRLDFNKQNITENFGGEDYLLYEDSHYRNRYGYQSKTDPQWRPQIVFQQTSRTLPRDLHCANYFRNTPFQLKLPKELALNNWCDPTPGRCDNILAAVVLVSAHYDNIGQKYEIELQNFANIRLDDCDINPNGLLRHFALREKPKMPRQGHNFVVGMPIVYEDRNRNQSWEPNEEAILAHAYNHVLVFNDHQPSSPVYAKLQGNVQSSRVLIDNEQLDPKGAWQIYRYSGSQGSGSLGKGFVIDSLIPKENNVINIVPSLPNPQDESLEGCYIFATEPERSCPFLYLPILMF